MEQRAADAADSRRQRSSTAAGVPANGVPLPAWSQQVVELEHAIATPRAVVAMPQRKKLIRGCLHDRDGSRCPASQRSARGEHFILGDPDHIDPHQSARWVPGRSIYLGISSRHYGHFLLETLSRFWALERLGSFDHYVFHHLYGLPLTPRWFQPARECFACFGIPLDRVIVVRRPLRFERVVLPSAQLEISNGVEPAMAATYRRVVEHCLAQPACGPGFLHRLRGWPGDGPLRLYFSRRRVLGNRPMRNERQVERVFTAAGFHILHPQQWSFARQVALYQRAEIIAGAEGSALHNSVFVRPGTRVINVGTPRRNSGLTLNQRMCDSLSGAESHFLPFAGTASCGERAYYDIDVLRTRLLGLLSDGGA
jgi:hypothetical protein